MRSRSVARTVLSTATSVGIAGATFIVVGADRAFPSAGGSSGVRESVEVAVSDSGLGRATLETKPVAVGADASGDVVLSNVTSATIPLAPPVVSCGCLLVAVPEKLEIPAAGKAGFRLSTRLSDRRRVSESALFSRADGLPLAIVEFLATSSEPTSGTLVQ